MKLPNMTDDIAWSIVDWIDPDEEPNAGGAETEYYGARTAVLPVQERPARHPRGAAAGQGRHAVAAVRQRPQSQRPARPRRGRRLGFNAGWAAYLTVYSRERNVDAEGNPRINLNGNDLAQLQTDLTAAVGQDTDHVHPGLPAVRQRDRPGGGSKAKQGGGGGTREPWQIVHRGNDGPS